jgi:ComEC/Rec2-related protein
MFKLLRNKTMMFSLIALMLSQGLFMLTKQAGCSDLVGTEHEVNIIDLKYKVDTAEVLMRDKYSGQLIQGSYPNTRAANLIPGGDYQLTNQLIKYDQSTDFGKYQLSKGICYQAKILDNSTLVLASATSYDRYLHDLTSLIKSVISNKASPLNGLTMAILLGDESGLDINLEKEFTDLGIVHLIAISGANFLLVLSCFELILKSSKLNNLLAKASLLVLAYIYFRIVGTTNYPALRAFTFLFVEMLGQLLGRKQSSLQKLSLSLALISISAPSSFWDRGFQLSLIAWSMIKIFLPLLGQIYEQIGKGIWVEFLSSAFSTTLLLPINMLFFEKANLISIPANVLFGFLLELVSMVAVPITFIYKLIGPTQSLIQILLQRFHDLLENLLQLLLDHSFILQPDKNLIQTCAYLLASILGIYFIKNFIHYGDQQKFNH